MKREASDLHGNAPDNSAVALLLVDVINDFEFPGGAELLRHALPAAKRIAALKNRCRRAGIPAIYINDNFGKWRSDFKSLVSHCLKDKTRGQKIVELLKPERDDYFVLKPKHSGFYSTTLDLLLQYLGTETLILTGFNRRHLHSLHRERRFHTRLSTRDPHRLCRFAGNKRESKGACLHEARG